MLSFLDCSLDSDEWDRKVKVTDPHYSSALYRAFGGGRLAFMQDVNAGFVAQPFRYQQDGWIGNAYNFGGPIGNFALHQQFSNAFDNWKHAHQLSERCTYNPFMDQPPPTGHYTELKAASKEVVVIDLEVPSSYRATTRQMIEKSARSGVITELVEPTAHNVAVFDNIYHDAMRSKDAAPHWFYPQGFFFKVMKELGSRRSSLFLTKVGGLTESGCLLIFDNTICYYHWAARKGNFPNLGTDHFQVDTVIEWARKMYMKQLHLGGGLHSNDGLFVFKSGFSPKRRVCRSYTMQALTEAVA